MSSVKVDRILLAAAAIVTAALAAVLADTLRNRAVRAGDAAPEFSIRTDAGLEVSRANFGGRVLVLNFWATWCPPCIDEMPSLDKLQTELKDSGVVVLGISVDEEEAVYRNFLARARVGFLTARDPAAAISSAYGTYRYPETFIIDRRGRVAQKVVGPTDWTDPRMVSYIKSLL